MPDGRFAHPRPHGIPILHQRWSDLAFLHWPLEPRLVRPLVPRALELETYDSAAWIGATPFRVSRIRPTLMPALPWLSDGLELNFRTYVRYGDVPGVWFFSLDITNVLAVIGARIGFRLPYYVADMTLERSAKTRRFRSRRTHPGARSATFEAEWGLGESLAILEPGTRDDFLIERYWLYTAHGDRVWRARIHHERWPLRRAWAQRFAGTLFAAHGLPTMHDAPLVHAQREPMHVEVWPLRRVDGNRSGEASLRRAAD